MMFGAFIEYAKTVCLTEVPDPPRYNMVLLLSDDPEEISKGFSLGQNLEIGQNELAVISAINHLTDITKRINATTPIVSSGGDEDDVI